MAATEAYSGICDMKILGASASSPDELSSLKYFNRFLRQFTGTYLDYLYSWVERDVMELNFLA